MEVLMKYFKIIFLSLALVLSFSACGGGSGDNSADEKATYESVTISPEVQYLSQGETHAFAATVVGKNSPDQSVIWRVVGGKPGTSVSNGLLTVSADEPDNTSITVSATSSADTSVSASTSVIIHQAKDIFGTWAYMRETEELDVPLMPYYLWEITPDSFKWTSIGSDYDPVTDKEFFFKDYVFTVKNVSFYPVSSNSLVSHDKDLYPRGFVMDDSYASYNTVIFHSSRWPGGTGKPQRSVEFYLSVDKKTLLYTDFPDDRFEWASNQVEREADKVNNKYF